MNKKRKIKVLNRDHLIQFLTVTVGVLLAFLINRAYDYCRDRKEERIHIVNMQKEIKQDKMSLIRLKEKYQEKKNKIEEIKSKNKKTPLYIIEKSVPNIIFDHAFFRQQFDTWEYIKASGAIKVIRSKKLRNKASELNLNYVNLYMHQDFIAKYYNQNILEYADKHINMNSMKFYNQKDILKPDFINLIEIEYLMICDYLTALTKTIKTCSELEEIIVEELK